MSEASSLTPYSAEYLSLLARKKKLAAKKVGKTWYTTKAVLDEYMNRQMVRSQIQNGNFPQAAVTPDQASEMIIFRKQPAETVPRVSEMALSAQAQPTLHARPVSNHPSIKSVRTFHGDLEAYLESIGGKKKAAKPEVKVPEPVAASSEVLHRGTAFIPKLTFDAVDIAQAVRGAEAPAAAVPKAKPAYEVVHSASEPKPEMRPRIKLPDLAGGPRLSQVPALAPKRQEKAPAAAQAASLDAIVASIADIAKRLDAISAANAAAANAAQAPKAASAPQATPASAVFASVSGVGEEVEKAIDRKFASLRVIPGTSNIVSRSFRTVFGSRPLTIATIAAVLFFVVFPTPFVHGFFDKAYGAVKRAVFDASTVMGFRPGTHENEILLLDKNGNVSIMGHIETDGQFRSFAKDGVAPIVVDSTTQVANLNAEMVGGARAQDFTLAFVTKNGNVTTDDVYFEGAVEIGKTLMVKGATKLLSSLTVDGDIAVFGDANFARSLTVQGPAYLSAIVNTGTATLGEVKTLGNVNLGKNLSVRGSVEIGAALTAKRAAFSTLGVTGHFEAGGDADFDGKVTVRNGVKVGKELTVGSDATIGGDLAVAGDATIGGTLSLTGMTVTGTTTIASLDVTGTSTFATLIAQTIAANAVTATSSSFVSSVIDTLTSTFATIATLVANDISVGALTATSTVTGNLAATNSTTTNGVVTNLVATNATSTTQYIETARIIDAVISSFSSATGTIASLASTNATLVNATTTNLYTANLAADTASTTNLTASNLTFANATGTNATTTSIFSSIARFTSGVIGNLFATNFEVTNSTTTNSTTTNAFATNLDVTNGVITNLTSASTTLGNVGIGSATIGNSTTTNATSSNSFVSNLNASNLAFTNATGTNATTSSFFSTVGRFATGAIDALTSPFATITNLIVSSFDAQNGTTTNATSTNSFVSNLNATTGNIGAGTITNLTATNATSTNSFAANFNSNNASTTNLLFVNATGTNATTTSIFSSIARFTSGVIGTFSSTLANITSLIASDITVGALTATNSTTTNATTTNSFVSNLNATTGNIGAGTITNLVATGATTTSFAVTGSGTTTIAGNLSVAGDVSFGDAAFDNVYLNGKISGDLVPDVNITRNVGSPSFYWNNGYFETLNVNSISAASTSIAGTVSNTFTINSDNVTADAENMDLVFKRGSVTPNAVLGWSSTLKRFSLNQATYIQNESLGNAVTLDVQGNAGQTTNVLRVSSSAGSPLFSVNYDGNVGVGTSSPFSKLSVAGNAYVGGNLTATGTLDVTGASTFRNTVNITQPTAISFANSQTIKDNGGAGLAINVPTYKLQLQGGTDATNGIIELSTNNAVRMTVANNGNVGVGTTSPASNLAVTGTGYFTSAVAVGSNSVAGARELGLTDSTGGLAGMVMSANGTNWFVDNRGNADGPNNRFAISTGSSDLFTILTSGAVGIGTSSPEAKLNVYGTGVQGMFERTDNKAVIGLKYNGSVGGYLGADTSAMTFYNGSAAETMRITSAGNVGIGTTTPGSFRGLELYRNNSAAAIGVDQSGSLQYAGFAINRSGVEQWFTGVNNVDNKFRIRQGSANDYVVVDTNGNVGVGTTTPSQKLSVNGNLYVGNTNGTGGTSIYMDGNNASSNPVISMTNGNVLQFRPVGGNTATGSAYNFLRYDGTNYLTILNNGNVGIGTTTPDERLSVNGRLSFTRTGGDEANAGKLDYRGYDSNALSVVGAGTTSSNRVVRIFDNLVVGYPATSNMTGGQAAFSGNVGIGNSAPAYPLSFASSLGDKVSLYPTSDAGYGFGVQGNVLQIFSDSAATRVGIGYGTSAAFTETMSVVGSNVGVGTTSPSERLSVQGNGLFSGNVTAANLTATGTVTTQNLVVGGSTSYTGTGTTTFAGDILARGIAAWQYLTAPTIQATSSTGTSIFAGGLTVGGTTLVADYSTGKVGIGTSSPFARLSLAGDAFVGGNVTATGTVNVDPGSSGSGNAILNLVGRNGGVAQATSIFANQTGNIIMTPASGRTVSIDSNQASGSKLQINGNFAVGSSFLGVSAPANGAIIEGNVGIGTSSPTVRLEVQTAANGDTAIRLRPGGQTGYWDLRPQYNNTNADLSFIANGTERVRFDANGNVGIGTTSPAAGLSIAVNNTKPALTLSRTDVTASWNFQQGSSIAGLSSSDSMNLFANTTAADFGIRTSTSGNANFVITSLGNVGVGTTSPFAKLSVAGNAYVGGNLTATGTITAAGITNNGSLSAYSLSLSTTTGSGASTQLISLQSGGGTNADGTASRIAGSSDVMNGFVDFKRFTASGPSTGLVFGTYGGELMTLRSSGASDIGYVGIGTSSPASRLYVSGTGGSSFTIDDSAAPRTLLKTSGASSAEFGYGPTGYGFGGRSTGAYVATANGTSISFGQLAATNPYMTIANGGNVGIGTTTPGANLAVQSTGGRTSILLGQGAGTNPGSVKLSVSNDENAGGNRLFIENQATNQQFMTIYTAGSSAGNVGIGTTAPNGRLEIVGGGGAPTTGATPNGQLIINGTGTTNAVASLGMDNTGGTPYLWLQPRHASAAGVYYNTALNPQGGNVGVGTTSPEAKLTVNGAISTNGLITSYATGEVFRAVNGGASAVSARFGNSNNDFYVGVEGNTAGGFFNGSLANSSVFYSTRAIQTIIGGISRMVVDTSGNVGIGTTSPGTRLAVQGDPSNAGFAGVISHNVNTAGYNGLSVSIWDGSANTTALDVVQQGASLLKVRGDGNVGIGTSTPTEKLTVSGNGARIAVRTASEPTNYYAYLESNYSFSNPFNLVTGSGGGTILSTVGNVPSNGLMSTRVNGSTDLRLQTGGADKVTIDASGDVGIGTTSPAAKLTVLDGSSVTNIGGLSGNTAFSGIAFTPSTGSAVTTSNYSLLGEGSHTYLNAPASGNIYFRSGNSDRMFMGSTGNVGIGTTTPAGSNGLRKALVLSDTANDAEFRIFGGGSTNLDIGTNGSVGFMSVRSNHPLTLATNNTERVRVDIDGNVGVGTAAPSYKLHVAGGDIGVDATNEVWLHTNTNLVANNNAMQFNTQQTGGWAFNNSTNGTSERMRLTAAGNLGVGTSSPRFTVEAAGTTGPYSKPAIGLGDGNGWLYFHANGGASQHHSVIWDNARDLRFGTEAAVGSGYSEKLRITSAGSVGIGTSSPTARVTIADTGNTYPLMVVGNNQASGVAIGTGGTGVPSINGYTAGFGSTANLALQPNGGNVGIGTTSPSQALSVAGNGLFSGNVIANNIIANGTFTTGNTTILGTNFDSNVATPGLDVNAAFIRVGDGASAQTMTNGVGIKFNDTSVQHASIKYLSSSNRFDFCQSGSNSALTCDTNKEALSIDLANERVGINTTSPSTGLDVVSDLGMRVVRASNTDQTLTLTGGNGSGTANITAAYALNLNSNNASYPMTFQIAGSEKARVDSTGNFGIGTSSPSSLLTVANGGVLVSSATPVIDLYESGGTNNRRGSVFLDNSIFSLFSGATNSSYNDISFKAGDLTVSSSERMRIVGSTGNVGVGTSTPATKLDVFGTSAAFDTTGDMRVYLNRNAASNVGTLIFTTGGASTANGWAEIGQAAGGNGDLYFKANSTAGSYSTRMLIQGSTGNVGIGTTTPGTRLDVYSGSSGLGRAAAGGMTLESNTHQYLNFLSGANAQQGIIFGSGNSNNEARILWEDGTRGNFLDISGGTAVSINGSNGGNVGVGTTSPTAKLNVYGTANVDGNLQLRVAADAMTGSRGILFTPNTFSGDQTITAYNNSGAGLKIQGYNTGNGSIGTQLFMDPGNGVMTFGTGSSGQSERMRIDNSGNVGIGTTSPSGRLAISDTNSYAVDSAAATIYKQGGTTVNNLNFIGLDVTASESAQANAQVKGIRSVAEHTQLYGTSVMGIDALARLRPTAATIGAFPALYGVSSAVELDGGSNPWSITNGFGFYTRPIVGSADTITNYYGLYVDALSGSGSVTNNYGVYQAASTAKNYFAGSVGIGTTSPTAKLSIDGGAGSGITIDGSDVQFNYLGDTRYRLSSNGTVTLGLASGYDAGALQLATGNSKSVISGGGSGNGYLSFFTGNNLTTPKAVITGGGSVGIGSTSPTERLSVQGGNIVVSNEANNPNVRVVDGSIITKLQSQSVGATRGAIGTESNHGLSFLTNNTNRVTIDTAGNVGIGTTTPYRTLHVDGAGAMFRVGPLYSGADRDYVEIQAHGTDTRLVSSNERFHIENLSSQPIILNGSGGFIGIGTTSPQAQLHVYGTGQLTSALTDAGAKTGTLNVTGASSSAGAGGAITLSAINDGGTNVPQAAIKSLLVNGTSNGRSDLAFSTRVNNSDTALTEAMRITSAGNVGVGTTSPFTKLGVVGNALIKQTAQTDATAGSFGNGLVFENVSTSHAYGIGYNVGGAFNINYRDGSGNVSNYLSISSAGAVSTVGPLTLSSTGTSTVGSLDVNGNIALSNSTGYKAIYTWLPTDANWRIGMNQTPGFTRALATSHVQYMTYAGGAGQGFAVGVNGGNSSFEVQGSDHAAFFRGNVGIDNSAPAYPYKLTVGNNSSATGGLIYVNSGNETTASGLVVDQGTNARTGFIKVNGLEGALVHNSAVPFRIGRTSATSVASTTSGNLTTELYISTAGNVGIGTVNPQGKLDVSGNIALSGSSPQLVGNLTGDGGVLSNFVSGASTNTRSGITVRDSWNGTNNTSGYVSLFVGNGSGNTEALRAVNGGNVGIGTSTPGAVGYAKLQVHGTDSSSAGPHMQFTTDSDSRPLLQVLPWSHDNVAMVFDGYFDGGWKSSSSGSNFKIQKTVDGLSFDYGNGVAAGSSVTWTTGMKLADTGNVGIGTTSPSSKLVIDGTNEQMLEISSGGTGARRYGMLVNPAWSNGSFHIYDKTADLSRIALLTNGNVGIGSTSPSQKLTVGGNIRTEGGTIDSMTYLALNSAASQPVVFNVNGGTEAARIQSSGNVGIGNNAPASKLTVGTDPTHDGSFDYSTAQLTVIDSNNNGGDTPNGTRDILHLVREGVNAQAYGNKATFALGRYEDVGVESRSQLDIKLTDGNFASHNTIMSLRSNGSVGIGTTSPISSSKVTITEQDANGSQLSLLNTRSGGNRYVFGVGDTTSTVVAPGAFFIHDIARSVTDFTIKAGNVGIGTTTPATTLEVSNGISSGPQLTVRNTGTSATYSGLQIRTDATTNASSRTWFMGSNVTNYGDFQIITSNAKAGDPVTAGTSRLTINPSGYVGVGTTGPTEALTVASGNILVTTGDSTLPNGDAKISQNGLYVVHDGATPTLTAVGATFAINRAGTALSVKNAGGFSAVFESGNVGIGTTNPAGAKLEITGTSVGSSASQTNISAFANNGVRINGSLGSAAQDAIMYQSGGGGGAALAFGRGGSYDTFMAFYTNATSNGTSGAMTERMRIDADGNLGVSTGAITVSTTTATSTFAGGFDVGNGAIRYDWSTGATSIDNLELGAMSFDADAGQVSWMDMPVTSAASAGTVQSYTAQLDGNPLLTVYGQSNGAGGIQYGRVGIASTTPWATLSVDANLSGGPSFAVGSSTKTDFLVTGAGNVGVGTTSPGSKLFVSGAGGAVSIDAPSSYAGLVGFNRSVVTGAINNPTMRAYQITADNSSMRFETYNSSGSQVTNKALVIEGSTGNVGIGTTTPTAKLEVVGSYPLAMGSDGLLKVKSLSTANGSETVSLQTSIDSRVDDYTISGYGGDSRHLLVLQPSGGYVGIGTTNPNSGMLHVVSNSSSVPAVRLTGAASGESGLLMDEGPYVNVSADSAGAGYRSWGAYHNGSAWVRTYTGLGLSNMALDTAGGINFQTDTATAGTPSFTSRLYIKNDGNVGIGTASPTALTNIYKSFGGGASGGATVLRVEGQNVSDANYTLATFVHGSNAPTLAALANGNVGVGTSSTSDRFEIYGDQRYLRLQNSSEPNVYYARMGSVYNAANSFQMYQNTNQILGANYNGQSVFLVPSSGVLGVATTTPIRNLDVSGTSLGLTSSSGATRLVMGNRDSSAIPSVIESANGNTYIARGSSYASSNGGTMSYTATFNSLGNVGIGVTTPASKLTIGNNVATGFLDTYAEYQIMTYDSGSPASSYGFGIKGSTMVFNSGAGAYSFDAAGNATRMVIDTSGNIGMGNDASGSHSDTDNLSVGSFSGSNGVTLRAANTGRSGIFFSDGTTGSEQYAGIISYDHAANKLQISTNGATYNSTSGMYLDSSGSLGIGTTSPSSLFSASYTSGTTQTMTFPRAAGSGQIGLELTSDNLGHSPALSLKGTGANGRGFRVASWQDGSTGKFVVRDDTAGSDRLTIDASGNVGIGTTSPISLLHVNSGSSDAKIRVQSSGSATLDIRSELSAQSGTFMGVNRAGANQIFSSNGPLVLGTFTGHDVTIGTSDAANVTVKNGGNVGIGTTSPFAKLSVSDSSAAGTTSFIHGGFFERDVDQRYALTVRNTNSNSTANNPFAGFAAQARDFTQVGNPYETALFGLRSKKGDGGFGETLVSAPREINFYVNHAGTSVDTANAYGTAALTLATSGNVGIGTSTPNKTLTVQGSIFTNAAYGISSQPYDLAGGLIGAATGIYSYGPICTGNNSSTCGSANGVVIGSTNASAAVNIPNSGNVFFNTSGIVGVGTASPTVGKLDVAGAIRSTSGYGTLPGSAAAVVLGAGGTTPNAGSIAFGDNSGWKFHIGTNASSVFTPRLTVMDTGNVGIGTVSPLATLDVSGTTRLRGNIGVDAGLTMYFGREESFGGSDTGGSDYGFIQFNNDDDNYDFWGASAENSAFIIGSQNDGANSVSDVVVLKGSAANVFDSANHYFSTGDVGIGTLPSTSYKLDVNGNTRSSRFITPAGTAGAPVYSFEASTGTGIFNPQANVIAFSSNSSESVRIDASGNLGVGTTSPGQKLSVAGVAYATGNVISGGNFIEKTISFTATTTGWWRVVACGCQFAAGTVKIYSAGSYNNQFIENEFQFTTAGYGQGGALFSTRGPSYNGGQEPIITSARIGNNNDSTVYLDLYVRATSTEPIVLMGYGPKMVSFSTPVSGASTPTSATSISLGQTPNTNNFMLTDSVANGSYFGKLGFGNFDGTSYQQAVQIKAVALGTPSGGFTPSGLTFHTGFNNGPTERLRIDDNGKVGIGTTSPASLFTVVGGGACFSGSGATVACGNTAGNLYYRTANTGTYDVAENYVTSDEAVEAADIVALDPANPLQIAKATAGRKVLGIISTDPGLVLGGADPAVNASTTRPVALSGRVPVKVNGEAGNITIGDRIALSSIPGVGRKAVGSEESVGTALESWSGGSLDQGMVTVFVANKKEFADDQFKIDASGNVGVGMVGTTTPSYKLQVNGDVAATSFVNISTRDAKHDIAYVTDAEKASMLAKLKAIGVATYRYNTESETAPLRLGLIAEEAPAEILAAGGKGVDVYKLSTFILAGVQELDRRFESLEATVLAQGGQIDSLRTELASTSAALERLAERVAAAEGQPGATSTASTTIVWSSDMGASVLSFLESVGMRIQGGIAYITESVMEKLSANVAYVKEAVIDSATVKALEVGSSDRRAGITLYDELTGQPYCLKIQNGSPVSLSGKCTETTGTTEPEPLAEQVGGFDGPATTTPATTPEASTSTPSATGTETATETATTTPETAPEAAPVAAETGTSTPAEAPAAPAETTTATEQPAAPAETTATEQPAAEPAPEPIAAAPETVTP